MHCMILAWWAVFQRALNLATHQSTGTTFSNFLNNKLKTSGSPHVFHTLFQSSRKLLLSLPLAATAGPIFKPLGFWRQFV